MEFIDRYKLKKRIKKFSYMICKDNTKFLNSLNKSGLENLLKYLECIEGVINKIRESLTNKHFIIYFESYSSIYTNFNSKTFLDEVKERIKEENLSRRRLFYSFMDGNTLIDDKVYKDLCKVSPDFSRSFLRLINKENLEIDIKNSSWFRIASNNYIFNILCYYEGGFHFKDDWSREIRALEEKVLGIKESTYEITSWKSSIAYFYKLKDMEEAIFFNDDLNTRRDMTEEIIRSLTYEGEDDDIWADDEFWESLGIYNIHLRL